MSKLTIKRNGQIEYINVMTHSEIEEAKKFLNELQLSIDIFQEDLKKEVAPSNIKYRYLIGRFLTDQIIKNNITKRERTYVWQEIQSLTSSDIITKKDRGGKRGFYEYCYLIAQFDEQIALSFTWSNWVDILDRSAATRDNRFVLWLAKDKKKIKYLRDLLVAINSYMGKMDTEVFDDQEIEGIYNKLYVICDQFNKLFHKYFEGKREKLTDARRKNLKKYKKKYIDDTLLEGKFLSSLELNPLCEKVFKKYFVDIDTSGNFKK